MPPIWVRLRRVNRFFGFKVFKKAAFGPPFSLPRDGRAGRFRAFWKKKESCVFYACLEITIWTTPVVTQSMAISKTGREQAQRLKTG
jgi:hypothetical protein